MNKVIRYIQWSFVYIQKVKQGSPYLYMSAGCRTDPGLDSQPTGDIVKVIYPEVGWHYYPPGLWLPSQPESITAIGTKLFCLLRVAHVCEQTAQSRYLIMQRLGVESDTLTTRSHTIFALSNLCLRQLTRKLLPGDHICCTYAFADRHGYLIVSL